MVKFFTILQIGTLILLHFSPAKAQNLPNGVIGKKLLPTIADQGKIRRGPGRNLEPGYYRATLVAGAGQRWMDQQRALRVMANEPCSNYLCDGKGALPVTLTSFDAARQDTATVLLNWETSAETNNQRFEIERSLDIRQGFEMVGSVDGRGNTGGKYRFQDLNRWSEVTYYRLKQIDLDGAATNSRIVSVKGARIMLSVLAYPNPGTTDNVRFRLEGFENEGGLSIELMDVKGVILYSNDAFKVEKNQSFELPKLPSLSTGMYILKISRGSKTAKVSFVIN